MTATNTDDSSGDETETKEVRVAALTIHPMNEAIYWKNRDDPRGQDFRGLVSTMETHGLENPIKIDDEKQILSGVRRWKAAQKLGWDTIEAQRIEVSDEHEALRVILLDNTTRKQWPPVIRYREANAFYDLYKQGDISKDTLAELAGAEDASDTEPQKLVAEAVGWSQSTYQNVAYVLDEERAEAEICQSLADSRITEDQKEKLLDELESLRGRLEQNQTSPYGAWDQISTKLDTATKSEEALEKQEAKETWETTARRGSRFVESLAELCDEGHVQHLNEDMPDLVRDQLRELVAKVADAVEDFEKELEEAR